jgi:intracellular multiplication protein IcmG
MNNQNHFRDEEYQFPHDEFLDQGLEEPSITPQIEPEQAQVEEEPKPSVLAGIWEKHKRTILIVGAVVIIGIVFAIMRAAHKPAVDTMPVKAPETPAPVVQAPQTIIDPQVVDQLTVLKQGSVTTTAAVQQLQGQVQQLNDSLSQSRAGQQQLAQSLMMLASQMQQLTAEVKILAQPKPEVKAPKAVVKADPAPVITFQLRAVVPGRAWIVGSDGRSLSVAIGDQVPQYGSVQSIDADAGVVITTSGKNIKFQ